MSSVIERRLLVNYRVDPDVAATLLPAPLRLELSVGRWIVEPAEVLAVSSSFFGDARLFPAGSATLDCALLMRDIPATWTAMTRNRERDFEAFRPC